MDEQDVLQVGPYRFAIKQATFRYITQSWSGPGWDFNFAGPCLNDDARQPLFPYGAALVAEATPLPLEPAPDLTGIEITLPLSYDEETGEALFGLNVMEEHEVSELTLRFRERDGEKYRIEITAVVAKTVLGSPVQLTLSAWATQLPDHAYPT